MIDLNELRKLAQEATPGPWSVVEHDHSICVQTESPNKSKYGASRYAAIGGFDRSDPVQLEEARANARIIAAANPAAVSELIDRLEAAEKERDVLRDRLAIESQENGALRDSVDRACEERDAFRTENAGLVDDMNLLRSNNTALRARIEAMEKQEPVVEVQWAAGIPNSFLDFISTDGYLPKLGDKLYALPGAKGEEK